GTVAGAVIGGLVGNQVGSGNGRKLATVAGAVGGGFAGREIDRRHTGGRVVERVDRQCRTVQDSSQSSRVVGYNVTYRNPDGTTGSMRTDSKPGNRIPLGDTEVVVGYDVTYRWDGAERRTVPDSSQSSRVVGYNVTYRTPDGTTGSLRPDSKPGNRIPLGDTEVVVGYDVTYRWDGAERRIRMDQRPGDRLPVIDGQVV